MKEANAWQNKGKHRYMEFLTFVDFIISKFFKTQKEVIEQYELTCNLKQISMD